MNGNYSNTVYKGLSHLYYSLHEDKYFPFESKDFDWNSFEARDKSVTDWHKVFVNLF